MTLELDGLEVAVDGFSLGPVSLTVRDEVLTVLGPSGCGKTTLLSLVAGFQTPDAGRLSLDGVDLRDYPIEDRGIVLMLQSGALFPHLTARENVAYAAETPELVDQYADLLDVADVLDQYPDTLSGGEQQRIALARSLAAEPDVLLLDEPLSSLDAPIRRRLRTEMRDVLGSLSIPVVYVTHDRIEATVVGDRLAVMQTGEVLQVDDPDTVLRRPATPSVARFTGSDNLFRGRVAGTTDDGKTRVEWAGLSLVVAIDDATTATDVWGCIRPEYVQVGTDLDEGQNVFVGTVTDRVIEGTVHRLWMELDAPEQPVVQATVQPAPAERARMDGHDRLQVRLPPEAIHLGAATGL